MAPQRVAARWGAFLSGRAALRPAPVPSPPPARLCAGDAASGTVIPVRTAQRDCPVCAVPPRDLAPRPLAVKARRVPRARARGALRSEPRLSARCGGKMRNAGSRDRARGSRAYPRASRAGRDQCAGRTVGDRGTQAGANDHREALPACWRRPEPRHRGAGLMTGLIRAPLAVGRTRRPSAAGFAEPRAGSGPEPVARPARRT